jgi:hypothetical protein
MHLTLLRLLLRRVGDVQPAAHLLGLLERADDDPIGQRLHGDGVLGGH